MLGKFLYNSLPVGTSLKLNQADCALYPKFIPNQAIITAFASYYNSNSTTIQCRGLFHGPNVCACGSGTNFLLTTLGAAARETADMGRDRNSLSLF